MGTYCALLVADYPVFSEKSQANAIMMTMFRESDKVIAIRQISERNRIEWGHIEWDPMETETVVEYTAPVAAIKDRLRIMGFSLQRVAEDFNKAKAARVSELIELSDGASDTDLWSGKIALLSNSSFADFLLALTEIVTSGVHYAWFSERVPSASRLALYMMEDHEDFYWGFPCTDLRCFIRALLEVVPEIAFVTQELTDLVDGGYYAMNAQVSELALQELKGNYSTNSPIVILTEGTTDAEVIRKSLGLLYPHLSGYYSFMDLAVRAPGGARLACTRRQIIRGRWH